MTKAAEKFGFGDVFYTVRRKKNEEKQLEKQGKKNCCIDDAGMYAVWRGTCGNGCWDYAVRGFIR